MGKKQGIGKAFQIGQYSVIVEDVIAEGGFAIVFLVKDVASGRRYALKRIYVNTERDLAMCLQEISILEMLQKDPESFAVRYLSSCVNTIDEEVKEVLILMEYYKHSVLQLMNERFQSKRHLSEEEVLGIFCDVCHAVGKLHNQRTSWIHRDLKVENVLMDHKGRCVICDFGSATSVVLDPTKHSIPDIEEELKKYTTISYRSPEMVNLYGLRRPITVKADIWALGVLLYKMCYFTLPFGESSLAIQNCNLQFPSLPVYSKNVQNLIKWCLRIDPSERPDIFQLASITCMLANRPCHVVNRNGVSVPSLSVLTSLSDIQCIPQAVKDPSPPRYSRPVIPKSSDLPNTTSIAPRERPKPATPSSGAFVLPLPPPKVVPSTHAVSNSHQHSSGVSQAPGRSIFPQEQPNGPFNFDSTATHPSYQFEETVRTPFHPPVSVPERPQRMGHRRNISDTSTIPAFRPNSPTPTNNASEKSRSADTSPARSPSKRNSDVDRKFSGWNPFEDASSWSAAGHSSPKASSSLTHSISSLVRKGSVGSGKGVLLVDVSVKNGAPKAKPLDKEKEKKKKFQYQKFDNDSDEEENNTDVNQPRHVSHESLKNAGVEEPVKSRDRDTDSIGSASDLKHGEDSSDEEVSVVQQYEAHPDAKLVVGVDYEHQLLDEDDDEAYAAVQYGTLEETARAIQNAVPESLKQPCIGAEVCVKPLLADGGAGGVDKSDDDELELRGRGESVSKSRSAFESMGFMSVFDQIPFRQPKKSVSKEDTLSSGKFRGVSFSGTNPFLDSFSTSTVTSTAASIPPQVPPKPAFLKKESKSLRETGRNSSDEDPFGSGPFESDTMTESLVESGKVAATKKKHEKARSPASSDSGSFVMKMHSGAGSPRLSKSPSRLPKLRKFLEKKEGSGISNISFED